MRDEPQILQSEGKTTANKLDAAECRARSTSSRQIRVWGNTPCTRFRSPILKTTLLEKPAGSFFSIAGIKAVKQSDHRAIGTSVHRSKNSAISEKLISLVTRWPDEPITR